MIISLRQWRKYMAHLTEVNTSNFESEVLSVKGKVLVDFWAPWCGPCRMQTPILEKLVASGVSAKIVKLNTDESPEIAGRFSIQSIPTMILFQDGKEIERMIGVQPEPVLKGKLA
jgi:thioredoxin